SLQRLPCPSLPCDVSPAAYPANSVFQSLRASGRGKFKNFRNCHFLINKNDIVKHYCFKPISHKFCPYCFVLCPACILTVLSAWKLRKVHGIQKVSL
ncbi:unnamed protein product, partial [Staurois parvus]